jgi:peptide/nickel transport system substrate-binding protein
MAVLTLVSGAFLAFFVSVVGGSGTAVAAPHKAPRVLRINLQDTLEAVDPAMIGFQLAALQLSYATCANLVNYPDGPWPVDQQPVPEVAAGPPTISADGKTYTFKLQTGFRFSNASKEPVTAETFKHAVERELAPSVDRGLGFAYDIVGAEEYNAGHASSISGIRVGKKKELIFQLERPSGDFLARLALPFFCAVPLGAPPPGPDTVVASAGPYYVEPFDRDGTTVLRRNPSYGGKRPRFFDTIVYQAHVPAATTESDIVAGNVDYAADGLPFDDYASVAAAYGPGSPAAQAGRQQFFVDPLPATRYIALNTSRPLFANALLRKAVNYAIDRPALAAATGAYSSTPTDQILPPGMPGFRDYDLYPLGGPDVATAQELAAQSGQTPATAVLYTCDTQVCHDLVQAITADLAPIGITVDAHFFHGAQIYQRAGTRGEPFDLATVGWLADDPDPSDFIDILLNGARIRDTDNTNLAYFDDPAFNQRMDAAWPLPAPARYEAYATLDHDLMADAAPWAPWGTINSRDFFSARIGCHTFNPFFGMDLAALCLR